VNEDPAGEPAPDRHGISRLSMELHPTFPRPLIGLRRKRLDASIFRWEWHGCGTREVQGVENVA
jgi:hypothetical protein